MLRPALVLVAALCLTTIRPAAQSTPAGVDLGTVLERLDRYLDRYEGALGVLMADEDFLQQLPLQPGNARAFSRRLESEVAFLRLPGNADWLGFRRVRRVDGKSVEDRHQPLAALLSITSGDAQAQAKLLVAQSAEYNLGNPRTINMPNLPLELLQRRHRDRFAIALDGAGELRGHQLVKVLFAEKATPSIVYFGGQQDLLSVVRAWVDPASGELHRVNTIFTGRRRLPVSPRLDVDFERHRDQRILVPTLMREEFLDGSSGLGTGRATYSNFRRFQTSARIVPPPP